MIRNSRQQHHNSRRFFSRYGRIMNGRVPSEHEMPLIALPTDRADRPPRLSRPARRILLRAPKFRQVS